METLLSQVFCQELGKASGNLGSSQDTRESKCVCGQHVLRAQWADAEVRPWGKAGCGQQRQAGASGDEIMAVHLLRARLLAGAFQGVLSFFLSLVFIT